MPITLQGRDYITHNELVQAASAAGLQTSTTEIIHLDLEGRTAVVKATISGERGTFEGLGDAMPDNVGRNIAPHFLRMAETRAISRALRLYLGRGDTVAEELNLESAPAKSTPDRWGAFVGWVEKQGWKIETVDRWLVESGFDSARTWPEESRIRFAQEMGDPNHEQRKAFEKWMAAA
tara:strand:+ start:5393 stop:5926 length:534 start_codon:yes stop_codon:yes gene_type:complete